MMAYEEVMNHGVMKPTVFLDDFQAVFQLVTEIVDGGFITRGHYHEDDDQSGLKLSAVSVICGHDKQRCKKSKVEELW